MNDGKKTKKANKKTVDENVEQTRVGNLRIVLRKVSELKPNPQNMRVHDERSVDAIAESLRRLGQQKPIVIDSDDVVWAGNGTLEAARKLGIEMLVCAVTELQGEELLKFAIADNRTAELSGWDVDRLHQQLAEMYKEGDGESLPPGVQEEWYLALAAKYAEPAPGSLGGAGGDGDAIGSADDVETDYRCPKCGHEWSGKAKP